MFPYWALTERRYTPYFGIFRFTVSLYGSKVRSREGHAPPLQRSGQRGSLCRSSHGGQAELIQRQEGVQRIAHGLCQPGRIQLIPKRALAHH